MKILLIPDLLDNWSAHNRTKQLAARLTEHTVEIASGVELLARDPDRISAFDLVHFHYSSGLHEWAEALRHIRRPRLLLGSAIGHRWHACGEDNDKRAETQTTIAILRTFDHVVVLSPQLHARCLASGITRATYIPNGVDRVLFPDRRRLRVGHVGPRFNAPVGDYKGGDLVAAACQRLGFDFTVPGCYGPERGPQCPGQRPQSRMAEWYRQIDVLCQPSAGEGCSNPIMEALAQNIRVVATPEAVCQDLWPYVTLCTRDVDDICRKLDTAPLIPTWDDIAERYRRLYASLC